VADVGVGHEPCVELPYVENMAAALFCELPVCRLELRGLSPCAEGGVRTCGTCRGGAALWLLPGEGDGGMGFRE